jgi:hypothetical protein
MTEEAIGSLTKVKFFKNRMNRLAMLLIFLSNLTAWAYIGLKIKPQANPIYLHYNIYFGVDLIGPWHRAFLMPAVGLLLILINPTIAFFLYKKNSMMAQVLLWLTFIFQLVILLASYLIVQQNL